MSALSKAADKCKSDSNASLPESSASKISDRTLRTAVFVSDYTDKLIGDLETDHFPTDTPQVSY